MGSDPGNKGSTVVPGQCKQFDFKKSLVFRIRLDPGSFADPDPGSFADPDPGFKSPDPSIYKIKGSR